MTEREWLITVIGIVSLALIILGALTINNVREVERQLEIDKAAIAKGLCQEYRGGYWPQYVWESCK
jgi:hypothetical protein